VILNDSDENLIDIETWYILYMNSGGFCDIRKKFGFDIFFIESDFLNHGQNDRGDVIGGGHP